MAYSSLARPWGLSDGVLPFQELNQRLKPDRFTDIVAILALGRPGPLGSGLVDQYVDSRHGIRNRNTSIPPLSLF